MKSSDFLRNENFQNYDDLTSINIVNPLILVRDISDAIIAENNNNNKLYWSINDLRRLKKYEKGFFNYIFHNLFKYFIKLLSYPDNNISLISFVLICEIFIDQQNQFAENWVSTLLPKLISQCVLKKYLEDLKLFNYVANNVFSQETLICLFDNLSNKSMLLSNTSYYLLCNFIKENFDALHLFYSGDWNYYFKQLINLYEMKIKFYSNKVLNIIKLLKEALGEELCIEIIGNLELEYEEIELIISLYDQIKSSKKREKKKNFNEFREEFLKGRVRKISMMNN